MVTFAQLSITEAGRPDRTVTVRDTATIGRDSGNDIVLESITVSHCHALLLRDADGLLLIDLESTNGTLVNRMLVPPDAPVRLEHGDVIRFGQVLARYVAPSERSRRGPAGRMITQAEPVCYAAREQPATHALK